MLQLLLAVTAAVDAAAVPTGRATILASEHGVQRSTLALLARVAAATAPTAPASASVVTVAAAAAAATNWRQGRLRGGPHVESIEVAAAGNDVRCVGVAATQ